MNRTKRRSPSASTACPKPGQPIGVVEVDKRCGSTNFVENRQSLTNMINLGIYLFNTETLKQLLIKYAREITSQHDFGKNILPGLVKSKIPRWLMLSMIIGWKLARSNLIGMPIWTCSQNRPSMTSVIVIGDPHPFRRTRAGLHSPQCQYPKFIDLRRLYNRTQCSHSKQCPFAGGDDPPRNAGYKLDCFNRYGGWRTKRDPKKHH